MHACVSLHKHGWGGRHSLCVNLGLLFVTLCGSFFYIKKCTAITWIIAIIFM